MLFPRILAVAAAAAAAPRAQAQQPQPQPAPRPDSAARVVAIVAPAKGLPAEKASAGVRRFSFIAYGDTRNSNDGKIPQEVHGLVVESLIAKAASLARGPDPVRFVVSQGDAVLNGLDAGQLNVSFVPVINRITAAGIPFFFTVGNHDVTGTQDLQNPRRAIGLANALAANANLLPPDGSPRRLKGYPTYAFGYGNTFVVEFDSNIAGDSVQYRWVRSQLESLDRRRFVNVVMVFHHPVFSSGPHGGRSIEPSVAALRQLYMPLFRKHHVKLLLSGHEHLFEHWVERYRDASGVHRMDEIVSGGGGAPIYSYTSEPDLTAYLAAGVPARVSLEHLVTPAADTTGNPHHYVVVHVDGEKLTVEVVGVGWGAGFSPYPGGRMIIAPDRVKK
jgi:hypothetical protein